MKNIERIIRSFMIGIGIGALIEAFISLCIGENIVGVPEFVESLKPGSAKIVQCMIYGGFGLVPELFSIILKLKENHTISKQIIHFAVLTSYFLCAAHYLKWYDGRKALIYSLIIFVIVYLVVSFIYYLLAKKTIDDVNRKLAN
ncbi:DUF3021 domain-containing protein [Peptoniphilus sp.]|uniref:DUF3021 domain-containing protein n=1 Tax=Peptoniphilus sp. TaxID=1971214 RepID=UPI0039956349